MLDLSIMNDENKTDNNAVDEPLEASDIDNAKSSESNDSVTEGDQIESNDEGGESADLAAAEAEILKYKDAFLRAKAEEDNVRRRAEKEVANSRKFAVEGFAKELLTVYDSLKLACAVELPDDADDAVKNSYEGVQLTLKQLNAAFAKFSLQEVSPAVGDKLDPNLHQAMTMVESEEIESGCIINVIQAGFELHDRLLRPAMVVVAK